MRDLIGGITPREYLHGIVIGNIVPNQTELLSILKWADEAIRATPATNGAEVVEYSDAAISEAIKWIDFDPGLDTADEKRQMRTALEKMNAAHPQRGPDSSEAVATVTYTNYRGETAVRRIIPKSVRYGSTEWHPEPQWLLLAWDDDKKADREFALKDFGAAHPRKPLDREKVAEDVVRIKHHAHKLRRLYYEARGGHMVDGETAAAEVACQSIEIDAAAFLAIINEGK